MPEPLEDPEGTGQQGTTENSTIRQMRAQIKKLEEDAAAKATADAAKLAETEKQLSTFQAAAAFDRLNIPSTGAGKLFRDTYQGDVTDEAITAAASQYDLIPAAPTTPQPTIPGVDQAAMARQIATLSNGQQAPALNGVEQLQQIRTTAQTGSQGVDATKALLTSLGVMDTTQG